MKVLKKTTEYLQFKEVEIREPLVEDLIWAERASGTSSGIEFALAVLSRICLFDGKQLYPEDLRKLRTADFLILAKNIETFGLEELAKELLSSQEKQDLSLQK